MSEKKVFISYSHDSEEHREKMHGLSERLFVDGSATFLRTIVFGPPDS